MLRSTLVILIVVLFCAQQSQADVCNDKEVDETVARIMTYGLDDRKYPTTKAELKKYCKEQQRLAARVDDYKNQCLKGNSKQVVSVILYSLKSLINTYCKNSAANSKRVNALINSAKCANTASQDYNKCSIEYIDRLVATVSIKDSKARLAQICCGYVRVVQCIHEMGSQKKFASVCTENAIEANTNYIRGYFDNAVNVGCGEYNDTSDKCDNVKPAVLKKRKSYKRPKSFFKPLVKLMLMI